ncbi:MAG: GntR family transcriptional regulator [Rhodospirillales bacterium]
MIPLGQRPILIEEAYRALLDEIAEGRLLPGQRVRQEELASQLQVSRQPVSHALALLKQDGFLVDSGRRGLEVAPLDGDYLLASYQVRAALDATAAGLAARRVRDQGQERGVAKGLGEAEAALERARRVADPRRSDGTATTAFVQADMAFHQALNRLSGNPVLVETAERQWGHLRRAMHAVMASDYTAKTILEEHAAILAAVRAGNPETAAVLAAGHAERAGTTTRARLIQQQSNAKTPA